VAAPTRDNLKETISFLLNGHYSASWASKITEVLQEKVDPFFLDGVVLKIRREMFIKEVKRRSKVNEVFLEPDAVTKVIYLVT